MKEALKMALEALECALSDDKPYIVKSKEAITAIEAALTQPAQEPWCMGMNRCTTKCEDCPDEPAQRPWVGLEKKDMPDGEDPMYDHPFFIAGMVWAANKLKEKNT